MKTRLLFAVFLYSGLHTIGQSGTNQYIGTNILQLSNTTINANYSFEYKPFLTPVLDVGYTFNYNYRLDFGSYYLAMHNDINTGYSLSKQSGGYLKLGGFLNLRNYMEKQNFFHLGIFFTNSIIYEKGTYLNPSLENPNGAPENIEHTVYLIGLNASIGYEFIITNRLKSNIDFQLSLPSGKYYDLYGIGCYIPGMGYCGSVNAWFPMLILNLKYKIN